MTKTSPIRYSVTLAFVLSADDRQFRIGNQRMFDDLGQGSLKLIFNFPQLPINTHMLHTLYKLYNSSLNSSAYLSKYALLISLAGIKCMQCKFISELKFNYGLKK